MSDDLFVTTFNGFFWLSLCGIVAGVVHLCLRYCERSRCVTCNLCDCLKIERTPEDNNNNNNIEILNRSKSLSTI